MKKVILISFLALFMTACASTQGVSVKQPWPPVPLDLTVPCPELEKVPVGTTELSEVVIIVADNLKSNEKYLLLEEGKKLEIKKPIIESGGGATNTAAGFSRLGLKTGIITKIGKDNTGSLIKKSLIDEGVNINLISEDLTEEVDKFIEFTTSEEFIKKERVNSNDINLANQIIDKVLKDIS